MQAWVEAFREGNISRTKGHRIMAFFERLVGMRPVDRRLPNIQFFQRAALRLGPQVPRARRAARAAGSDG